MEKNIRWAVWMAVVVGGLSCEQKQHSQIQKPKDRLAECLGSPLTAEQEAKIRKQINAESKTAEIEEIFRKKRKAGFNGNVLIAQKGVVLYENAFGYAHLRQKDTLRNQHAFQLASLSKPFTSVAILKLVEAGQLSLEDSIQRFFPDFPYRGISIQALLSHRSGLPNYAYAFPDSVRHGRKYPSNQAVMEWFARVKPSPRPYGYPNRAFNYSNTNYCVLAAIVEKVSGMTFGTYLDKTIFTPLGMKSTFLSTVQNDSTQLFRTVGHERGYAVPKDYYDEVVGDKGLYSTTEDLYRFYRGLTGGCLLKKRTLEEAYMPRSFERKSIKNYGYGFRMHLDERQQPRYIYHTGWWKGYNTIMWMSPEDDFVIIILSNSYNRSVYQVKDLLDVLHGQAQADDVEKDL
ncbi:CubicO group peptidase (beta-lactamase class C family) [Rhabdobacter roseus]|uniref:CubicO group peptidase (Beta-lactamase class C family) n=1 Tax=Rhabdobacter roseus TaxID=1655419 RepID=A0A840TRH8_9BACT|nr:CubicO group peptidase (beta-lactamase class C family) [Rhabdobacter roseus]